MADPKRRLIQTGDGSYSLEHTALDETYHSRHGALQESLYVFIQEGFKHFQEQPKVAVFEMGFGTGLNALLTADAGEKTNCMIYYEAIETHPVTKEEALTLGYTQKENAKLFQKMHSVKWDEEVELKPGFTLHKRKVSLFDFDPSELKFDLIYYDAFGYRAQPEMWLPEHFVKMFQLLRHGGMLVTYCAKGQVRRDMEAAGFEMERLPGPPGKRHMLRGKKP